MGSKKSYQKIGMLYITETKQVLVQIKGRYITPTLIQKHITYMHISINDDVLLHRIDMIMDKAIY